MYFERGNIVFVNVPRGRDPRHGWSEGIENHTLGITFQGYSDHTTFYNSERRRGVHDNKELILVNHPFTAVFTSLGRGIVTATFDAPDKEKAIEQAKEFASGKIADVSGRKVDELTWLVNEGVDLSPVLIGVEDKKPLMETALALIMKRNGL